MRCAFFFWKNKYNKGERPLHDRRARPTPFILQYSFWSCNPRRGLHDGSTILRKNSPCTIRKKIIFSKTPLPSCKPVVQNRYNFYIANCTHITDYSTYNIGARSLICVVFIVQVRCVLLERCRCRMGHFLCLEC